MRTSGVLVFVLAFAVLVPMPIHAQGVEVGVGLAASCKINESSVCHRKWGTTRAVYGNWWVSEGIVIELRGARLDGPQSRIVGVPEEIAPHSTFFRHYLLQNERRRLVQASFVYHFLHTGVVRPFLGLGPGVLWWKGEASCPRTLIECERVIPNGAPGQLNHTALAFGLTAGVAFHAPNGVIVRSGTRGAAASPQLPRRGRVAELPEGLPEYFASLGYRW